MPIIQLLIYTDIGKVRVAPKEQTVVIGKGCGELMGGKNLGDLEVVETVVFGKLLRQLSLAQTGVAPAVNASLIVHCYNVVKAGSNLRDLRLLDLLGNIGDIDHTGNLGFTPNINITVHIYTGGEIGADRNIGDALILQLFGIVHHGISWGYIDQGAVLLSQIQHNKTGSNKHKQHNKNQQYKRDNSQWLGEEALCHHTGRALQRFLCVNVHFLIWEKQAGEPAAQCPLLLPGACLLILFTHIQQPPSLLVYTNAGIDQTVAQVGKQYAHQAHHGIEHLHGKHQLIVGVVQCLPVQPAGAV